jgi:hypothetical protein
LYEVTLTLNNDVDHIIKKQINIFANAIYLNLLTGTKIWHHVYTDAAPSPPYHTSYVKPDVEMTLSYIAPSSIAIGTDTLLYIESTRSDSIMVFNHYVDAWHNNTVHFNHVTSNIYYFKDIHISAAAGNTTDYYYTP